MRNKIKLATDHTELFKKQLLHYGNHYKEFAFLDSSNFVRHNTKHTYYEYDFIAALGAYEQITGNNQNDFQKLDQFVKQNNDWLFGYLTYDLKNELEKLESNNPDFLNFPSLHFFVPEIIILSKDSDISVLYENKITSEKEVNHLIQEIKNTEVNPKNYNNLNLTIQSRFSKDEYIATVDKFKEHIQRGDIYEANFCQEFFAKTSITPVSTYIKLKEISPTPFSCYYKLNDLFLLSASPERFMKKTGSKIISQPIKGTKKRVSEPKIDQELKNELLNDPKERAENVMIVDLVRNDLSRTAKKGTVKVEELFGVYSFKQVHQLISTITSEIDDQKNIVDVIKKAFPMGSMTGAPKIKAMELIEKFERTKRGLYSGAVGFISPEKDFDFNVVIRSILYNDLKKYVSFTVGGAITSLAIAENEYEECLLKAKAMTDVLK